MHVKEIYVIFIHLFDSAILLIIDLNKKKKGGYILLAVSRNANILKDQRKLSSLIKRD